MTTREDRIHTIRDFLQRPIVIHTGLWSSNVEPERPGSELYTANFPEVLISNPMYQEKLRGFVGLRATLVIKVQVNSQPFQQGRLLLQYFPYAQYMQSRVALVNKTLQGRSGCPRTDLDLSMGTEIEMRIPYVSPHVYYNLITGQGSFGAIYLNVYSQLRDQVSGTGDVEYTVWAHMEDVDVQYPTGASIYTGSSPNYVNLAEKLSRGRMTAEDVRDMINDKTYTTPPARIFAQSSFELTQLKENNSTSKGVGQIAEGLNTLTKTPVIGNVFTRPAWISAAATNIFKMLGYSKPTVQGLPCESKLRGQTRMANYDGADTSHKLALSSSNEIETKSGLSGTSSDEMALAHVLSIPNYWDRFTWPSTGSGSETGSVLWDSLVTPYKIKNYSSSVNDVFRSTHMGYVANSFGLWRGSVVYTFKFVKTQFHSGVPDTSKAQRMIVDLRKSTEVAFTVPYVSSRPWMFCTRPDSISLGKNAEKMYNCVTGIVRVEVLNKLVAANSVYPSIDTIVEVNGGPDLVFANPTCPSYVPYGGAITATAEETDKGEEVIEHPRVPRPRAQTSLMGANEAIPRNEAQKGSHPQAIDTHVISSNWSPEANCVGEKIMSIRQLIKRFGQFGDNSITLNESEGVKRKDAIILAPFSHRTAPTTIPTKRRMTQLDYYYYLFAFWRGSMRFKVISETYNPTKGTGRKKSNFMWDISMFSSIQDTMDFLISVFQNNGDDSIIMGYPQNPGVDSSASSNIIVDPSIEGVVEFEVPYYNVSHISPATQYAPEEKALNFDNVWRGHIPPCAVVLRPRTAPAENNEVYTSFWRAPGDDFSLSYLVGVPPLVNLQRTYNP